ncbi:MAG: hypothetical protein ACRD3C_14605 [Vicinamibacterales bacterium]
MRTGGAPVLLLLLVMAAAGLDAAEHPALAKARALHNAADFDGAIAAAAIARADPASADAAALVGARSYLERYRLRTGDPADLTAAREALGKVQSQALSPRDQMDLLLGLGQALYLANTFGAAAELFDIAWRRAMSLSALSDRERSMLLDWWANAVDREAQTLDADRRGALLRPVMQRMDDELRDDPGNATANYWLAVAARGSGDVERAWHAAVAAWVRAPLQPVTAATLRGNIDRFVTTVLIPERSRARPPREQQAALLDFQTQWERVKQQWP